MPRPEAEPERDPPRRQPVFNVPWPVAATLAVLLAIHAGRQIIPDGWDDALFLRLALVPGRLTSALAPDRVVAAVMAHAARGGAGLRQAQVEGWVLANTPFAPWTSLTYALLHADWAHVGLNGVGLLAFGTPVARRLRPARFFALLVAAAWAGAVVQWACRPLDVTPVIGASAAVSGCMGAVVRFVFRPRLPVAAPAGEHRAEALPAIPLRAVLRDTRALTFVIAWLFTDLLFGIGPVSLGVGGGPIAWQAHIGGFAVGLLLFALFDPVRSSAAGAAEGGAAPRVS